MRAILVFSAVLGLAGCQQQQPATPAASPAKQPPAPQGKAPFIPPALPSIATALLPIPVKLNVKYHQQQAHNWCWAAAGQMVMETIKKSSVMQCQQADKVFNKSTCCPVPTQDYCDNAWDPVFRLYGLKERRAATITDSEAVHELGTAKRPFVFRIDYDHGLNHYFVAYGFRYVQGRLKLDIYDSAPGSGAANDTMDFSSISTGTGLGGKLSEVIYEVQ